MRFKPALRLEPCVPLLAVFSMSISSVAIGWLGTDRAELVSECVDTASVSASESKGSVCMADGETNKEYREERMGGSIQGQRSDIRYQIRKLLKKGEPAAGIQTEEEV